MINKNKKEIIIREIIPELKARYSYFSYSQINRLLLKKRISVKNTTFKKYIFKAVKSRLLFDAGKGWYSFIEKEFLPYKEPCSNLVKEIRIKFPLLSFLCWSTEQLNSFTHHMLSKFVTFVYVESDYIGNVSEVLKNSGHDVYENPTKSEISKYFRILNKTIVLLPSITKQPDTGGYCYE